MAADRGRVAPHPRCASARRLRNVTERHERRPLGAPSDRVTYARLDRDGQSVAEHFAEHVGWPVAHANPPANAQRLTVNNLPADSHTRI